MILHPRCGPPGGIDVRPALVRAIAYELWVLTSGAEVVNWLEAEMLLDELLTRSR